MAQWMALGVVVLGNLLMYAAMWGRMTEQIKALKAEVKDLRDNEQTPNERKAISDAIEFRFRSQDEKHDLRFAAFQEAIHLKLDAILTALNHVVGK